ncbi:MAG TPA: type IV pilus assembly protein PilM [Candidatus Bathyarchaeia archaeon]|nr:type IV pilus assembly protein PilM [Candidatus Bathyarchaeia archaeon]
MPAYFGLDIGSYSIKAVQVEKKRNQYNLVTFGEVKTPASLTSQAEIDKRAIVAAIKKLLLDAEISTKEVILSLSEASAFSQVIELPYLSQTELSSAIQFEAEQYIPVPLDEVKLEYLVLSSSTTGVKEKKMEVLLVAAKQQTINQILELVETAELIPLVLETDALSLVRAANLSFQDNCLFLNLGHNTTNILLLQNQILRLVRTIKTAGAAFTRAVSRDLNMELFQAEQYKTAYGLQGDVFEGKIAKAIQPIFNIILNELKKALSFFLQKYPEVKINTLIVSGGGAAMPGLNAYLAQSLNLEVVNFDPFINFAPDKRFAQIIAKARFATAVGLAVREDK